MRQANRPASGGAAEATKSRQAPRSPPATKGAFRAFELLAAQPTSLVGLTAAERDRVVVTAVSDADGHEHPVSRFGDPIWDLGSEVKAKNVKSGQKYIAWPQDVPRELVDDAKAAVYCALRRGRHQGKKWSASASISAGRRASLILKHLRTLGIRTFSEVRALHLSDYIASLRSSIKPSSIRHRLEVVDLVYWFPEEMCFPLAESPWGGASLNDACGCNEELGGPTGRTGKTPVIPRSVQRAVLAECEARLGQAAALFKARDAGEIGPVKPTLTGVRDAVLFMLQITSGMRNAETVGVTNRCWRVESKAGVDFHWIRTRELKTTGGRIVDFLIPGEVLEALEILQRYATPLQARLAAEAEWLRELLASQTRRGGKLSNGMTVAQAVQRLKHIEEIKDHLFLSVNSSRSDHLGLGSRVDVLSGSGCNLQLRKLAKAAGQNWPLANHQCRRTFAYNVANSRLGRMGLVFLKWQFKHASMSWTQLYASNPLQDHSLYREFEEEMTSSKLNLMVGWMEPGAALSGGAGRKLMQTRAIPARDVRTLLEMTAPTVELRSTGHAWCISGTRGCEGQGVYDPSMCGGCSQAIIDQDQATAWQMIHLDNLGLAALVDCGPAVQQKAARAIERSSQVLSDLGVQIPSGTPEKHGVDS